MGLRIFEYKPPVTSWRASAFTAKAAPNWKRATVHKPNPATSKAIPTIRMAFHFSGGCCHIRKHTAPPTSSVNTMCFPIMISGHEVKREATKPQEEGRNTKGLDASRP